MGNVRSVSRAVQTAQLTVLDRDQILYIDGCESTHQLRTFFDLGDRAPLHCTALGKAILAFLPPPEVERVIRAKGLRRFTANTLTRVDALRSELARTVERGYRPPRRSPAGWATGPQP